MKPGKLLIFKDASYIMDGEYLRVIRGVHYRTDTTTDPELKNRESFPKQTRKDFLNPNVRKR